jgi:K+-transporting ATPase KdpF subunit
LAAEVWEPAIKSTARPGRSRHNAGSTDGISHGSFLCDRAALCARLREIEVNVPMSANTLVVLILTILILIYLVFTLLRPEKF